MKTVVFPDLHQPSADILSAIESVIDQDEPDRIVFLGDYFDQFNDSPEDARRTAQWLKKSLTDPRRTHLIGNHDPSYLWPCDATFCPGFTWEIETAIRRVLRKNSERLFVFHAWTDGWLLTHAGLSAAWVPDEISADMMKHWLARDEKAARKNFATGRPHWFVAVGRRRGGYDRAGGILWCDWQEKRWPGKQLCGHTPAAEVRTATNGSVCLDTNMGNGPKNYAVIIDGLLTVHKL